MRYKILKDGVAVNTIVSSEEFVFYYCEKNGFAYELIPELEISYTSSTPTTEERVADLEEAMYLLLSGATGEEVTEDAEA